MALSPEPSPPVPPWPGVPPWSERPPPGSPEGWGQVRVDAPPLPENGYDDLTALVVAVTVLVVGLVIALLVFL